jgi:transcriptional regulator with XRE-family HTH domain
MIRIPKNAGSFGANPTHSSCVLTKAKEINNQRSVNMKFGEFLRQQRETQNWTQPDAAAKIEIEQSYLSKLETGKSYPSEDIFSRLAAVYQFDAKSMNQVLFAAELDKLREVKQVREAVLSQNKKGTSIMRTWLLIGLASLMFAGVCLGVAVSNHGSQVEYSYRSDGVILDGEDIGVFELIYAPEMPSHRTDLQQKIQKKKELLKRIDQVYEVTATSKGNGYIKKTLNGMRYFDLVAQTEIDTSSTQKWAMAFGLMFLFAGLASFYIGRYWR